MFTAPGQPIISPAEPPRQDLWQRRFFISLTVLASLAIAGILLWVIGLIVGPVFYLIISALLSYALYPLVQILQRFIPRPLAILITFFVVLFILILMLFFVLHIAVEQLILLISSLQTLFQSDWFARHRSLAGYLNSIGISQDLLHQAIPTLVNYVHGLLVALLPILGNLTVFVISILIITSLTVYFTIDGPRFINRIRRETPARKRPHINFLLDAMERSIGGFIRGQLFIATVIAAISGVGAYLIGIPYPMLFAVIVFIFEFVPIIGSYVSGMIGMALGFTQGLQTGIIMTIFVMLVNGILEAQILAPRILGHAVGLHPIVALFVLLVGSSLFGIMGALLACPVAGVIQMALVAGWQTWRKEHPDEFPEEVNVTDEARPKDPEVRTT